MGRALVIDDASEVWRMVAQMLAAGLTTAERASLMRGPPAAGSVGPIYSGRWPTGRRRPQQPAPAARGDPAAQFVGMLRPPKGDHQDHALLPAIPFDPGDLLGLAKTLP
jgi:hypothetical protein